MNFNRTLARHGVSVHHGSRHHGAPIRRDELLEMAAYKRDQARRFKCFGRGLSLNKDRVTMAECAADLEREAVRLEAEAAVMKCRARMALA